MKLAQFDAVLFPSDTKITLTTRRKRFALLYAQSTNISGAPEIWCVTFEKLLKLSRNAVNGFEKTRKVVRTNWVQEIKFRINIMTSGKLPRSKKKKKTLQI